MRAILFWVAGWMVCSPLCAASDAPAVAAEVRRLDMQLDGGDIARVLAATPEQWDISTAQGSYIISSKPLRELLVARDATQAKEWLEHLAAHLEGSLAAPRSADNAKRELTRILARREFEGVGPPGRWELVQERIREWVGRFFERLFGFVAQYPTESKIFFWTVIGGAVLAFLIWLFRRWDRAELVTIKIASDASPRTSNQWILAARAFSGQGDFRKAIQCAYWAAIVRLEEIGTLPRNRPHTPREYLGLVSNSRIGGPSQFSAPLAALTKLLERCWYAGNAATAQDFSACLSALEGLGCRVD